MPKPMADSKWSERNEENETKSYEPKKKKEYRIGKNISRIWLETPQNSLVNLSKDYL